MNTQKTVVFLDTSSERSKKEIEKTIKIKISLKHLPKYLWFITGPQEMPPWRSLKDASAATQDTPHRQAAGGKVSPHSCLLPPEHASALPAQSTQPLWPGGCHPTRPHSFLPRTLLLPVPFHARWSASFSKPSLASNALPQTPHSWHPHLPV